LQVHIYLIIFLYTSNYCYSTSERFHIIYASLRLDYMYLKLLIYIWTFSLSSLYVAKERVTSVKEELICRLVREARSLYMGWDEKRVVCTNLVGYHCSDAKLYVFTLNWINPYSSLNPLPLPHQSSIPHYELFVPQCVPI
jgi:hypothetical protein